MPAFFPFPLSISVPSRGERVLAIRFLNQVLPEPRASPQVLDPSILPSVPAPPFFRLYQTPILPSPHQAPRLSLRSPSPFFLDATIRDFPPVRLSISFRPHNPHHCPLFPVAPFSSASAQELGSSVLHLSVWRTFFFFGVVAPSEGPLFFPMMIPILFDTREFRASRPPPGFQ